MTHIQSFFFFCGVIPVLIHMFEVVHLIDVVSGPRCHQCHHEDYIPTPADHQRNTWAESQSFS